MQLNRAARRAQQARARHTTIAVRLGDLFDPAAAEMDSEELIRRAIARIEDRFGTRIPADQRSAVENGLRLQLANIRAEERGMAPVASAVRFDDARWEEGRRCLAELLPRAREIACEDQAPLSPTAPHVAAAFRDNGFRLADLEAIMIYEAPADQPAGWHADIVFARELPPIGNTIGTKVASPCRTREEAEATALQLLAGVVTEASQRADA